MGHRLRANPPRRVLGLGVDGTYGSVFADELWQPLVRPVLDPRGRLQKTARTGRNSQVVVGLSSRHPAGSGRQTRRPQLAGRKHGSITANWLVRLTDFVCDPVEVPIGRRCPVLAAVAWPAHRTMDTPLGRVRAVVVEALGRWGVGPGAMPAGATGHCLPVAELRVRNPMHDAVRRRPGTRARIEYLGIDQSNKVKQTTRDRKMGRLG
jgi:hypothetical protein